MASQCRSGYHGVAGVDAPAFVEREQAAMQWFEEQACVAGVDAPAFVERTHSTLTMNGKTTCVAGVDAPAFVERARP